MSAKYFPLSRRAAAQLCEYPTQVFNKIADLQQITILKEMVWVRLGMRQNIAAGKKNHDRSRLWSACSLRAFRPAIQQFRGESNICVSWMAEGPLWDKSSYRLHTLEVPSGSSSAFLHRDNNRCRCKIRSGDPLLYLVSELRMIWELKDGDYIRIE